MKNKRFLVLMGNYGSGKTEIAMQLAYDSAERGERVLMIDLDMINTYFRLYDHKQALESAGIALVAPDLVASGIEMLTIPPEIAIAFDDDWDTVVIDLGGDTGALALGQFHNKLSAAQRAGAEIVVYNVVNTNRPMADTPEKIVGLMDRMQGKARWQVTGMIHNSNMAGETTTEDLLEGLAIIKRAVEQIGVPVLHTAGTRTVLEDFLRQHPEQHCVGQPLFLEPRMHRSWVTMAEDL